MVVDLATWTIRLIIIFVIGFEVLLWVIHLLVDWWERRR